jgi:dGTPase
MTGSYLGELLIDGERSRLASALKEIGRSRIYRTQSNLKLELMGRKIILDLMDLFWEGANSLPIDRPIKTKKFPGKIQALLSENYRHIFFESVKTLSHLPQAYHRLQLVTDYVCGMTDSFAKRLHAELNNG